MSKCRERQLKLNASVQKAMAAEESGDILCCEKRKARFEICMSCSSRTSAGVCKEDIAFVSAKVSVKSESCPLGKWSEE